MGRLGLESSLPDSSSGVGEPTVRKALAVLESILSLAVSLLAYGGPCPGAALALAWADIGQRSISVERSVALGDP